MADKADDSFAAARTSLRDTAKWMATVLAGLGAAVAGGITVSGFASLTGSALQFAIWTAVVAMLLILIGIGLLVRLLGVEAYYFSDLESDAEIVNRINRGGKDLLPPGYLNFVDLTEGRNYAYAALAALANRPAGDPARVTAEATYETWQTQIGRLLSFASFLVLRRQFNWTMIALLFLFVGTSTSLSLLGYQLEMAASEKAESQAATLEPIGGWGTLAAELGRTCSTGPFTVETVGEAPFAGWWTVKLTAPSPCAGALLTVPDSMVKIVAKP